MHVSAVERVQRLAKVLERVVPPMARARQLFTHIGEITSVPAEALSFVLSTGLRHPSTLGGFSPSRQAAAEAISYILRPIAATSHMGEAIARTLASVPQSPLSLAGGDPAYALHGGVQEFPTRLAELLFPGNIAERRLGPELGILRRQYAPELHTLLDILQQKYGDLGPVPGLPPPRGLGR
jgi:hypothetical protein